MKNQRVGLLAAFAIAGLSVMTNAASAEPESRSPAPAFSTPPTGTHIPRRPVKGSKAESSSSARLAKKSKRQRAAEARRAESTDDETSKPAAKRPADNDYVTRGGFR